MELQLKTFYDAILPIVILNWFTGMSFFEYPLGKPRLMLSFIYIFLSYSCYCYAYSHGSIKQIPDKNELRQTIFQTLEYSNFFISTFCIVIGWYYHKAYKIVIKRIELLDEALEALGLDNKYWQIFINSLRNTVMWIIMIGTIILFDVYYLIQMFDLSKCLYISFLFHYPIQLNAVVDFTFTSIVNYIGLKFDNINFLLKRILLTDLEIKSAKKWYQKHNRISALVMSTERSDILNNKERQKNVIILIRHLHMELTKISFQLNKVYQIQMTMVIVAFVATTTGFWYVLFSTTFFVDKTFPENSRVIWSISGWCALYVYRILNVNCICGKVSAKSQRTRHILDEIKNTIENAELKEEIEQFSFQLFQRPLVFSVCGFAILDYSLIERFIKTVSTYLVILIQYDLRSK